MFYRALIIDVDASTFSFPSASVLSVFLGILPENHHNGGLGRKIYLAGKYGLAESCCLDKQNPPKMEGNIKQMRMSAHSSTSSRLLPLERPLSNTAVREIELKFILLHLKGTKAFRC